MRTLRNATGPLGCCAFHPANRNLLLLGTAAGELLVLNASTGRQLRPTLTAWTCCQHTIARPGHTGARVALGMAPIRPPRRLPCSPAHRPGGRPGRAAAGADGGRGRLLPGACGRQPPAGRRLARLPASLLGQTTRRPAARPGAAGVFHAARQPPPRVPRAREPPVPAAHAAGWRPRRPAGAVQRGGGAEPPMRQGERSGDGIAGRFCRRWWQQALKHRASTPESFLPAPRTPQPWRLEVLREMQTEQASAKVRAALRPSAGAPELVLTGGEDCRGKAGGGDGWGSGWTAAMLPICDQLSSRLHGHSLVQSTSLI